MRSKRVEDQHVLSSTIFDKRRSLRTKQSVCTPTFDYAAGYKLSNVENSCAQCFFLLRNVSSFARLQILWGFSILGLQMVLFVCYKFPNCAEGFYADVVCLKN